MDRWWFVCLNNVTSTQCRVHCQRLTGHWVKWKDSADVILSLFTLSYRHCDRQRSDRHVPTARAGLQGARPRTQAPKTHRAPSRDLCMSRSKHCEHVWTVSVDQWTEWGKDGTRGPSLITFFYVKALVRYYLREPEEFFARGFCHSDGNKHSSFTDEQNWTAPDEELK